MSKHTPGPWNVTHESIIPRVYGPDDNLITEIQPQRRRDAHLIAAAPAMYEALKASLLAIPDGMTSNTSPICQQIRAALAQAEGSKP